MFTTTVTFRSTMATRSKFLELPSELRLLIYKFAFEPIAPPGPAAPAHLYQRGHSSLRDHPVPFDVAFLTTCKTIYEECAAMLYQNRLGTCSPFICPHTLKPAYLRLFIYLVLRDKTYPILSVLIRGCSRYCGWPSALTDAAT